MDARQRVALALDHKEPDRVPIDYWATSTVTARLLDHFGLSTQEELLQHLDVDFRYIDGPKYVGPEPDVHEDGSIEDHWGVPRVRVKVGSGGQESVYREVLHFPLKHAQSVDEVRDYPKWPSPDWFDYACVADQVAEAGRTGKVVVFMGDRMNRCAQLKPAMYLRGVQARFTDPGSGEVVPVGSFPHTLGELVMAAVSAGFTLDGVGEYAPDAGFAARCPRAEKYVGWPMLVILRLRR